MIWNSQLKMLRGVVAAVVIFFAAANMQAQVTGGTISGTVTDSSGKVVANARISIANIETGSVAKLPPTTPVAVFRESRRCIILASFIFVTLRRS